MQQPIKIATLGLDSEFSNAVFSFNLAYIASQLNDSEVVWIDMDVENKNLQPIYEQIETNVTEIERYKPQIIRSNCVFCARCIKACKSSAITAIKELSYLNISDDICCGCKACEKACRHKAIKPKIEKIGVINHYKLTKNFEIFEGRLQEGVVFSAPIIRKLKKEGGSYKTSVYNIPHEPDYCVQQILKEIDYLLLIVSPHQAGIEDIISFIDELSVRYGIILNESIDNKALSLSQLTQLQDRIIGKLPSAFKKHGFLLQHFDNNRNEALEDFYKSLFQKILA